MAKNSLSSKQSSSLGRLYSPLILAGMALAIFALWTGDYTLLSNALAWGLAAMAFDVCMGHAGVFSFGHSAMMAAGAYTAGLMVVHVTPNLEVALVSAMAVGALIGGLMALVTVRRSHLRQALITMGIAELLRVFIVDMSWTGSANGFAARPDSLFAGASGRSAFIYTLIVVGIAAAFLIWLYATSFGRVMHGVRDDSTRMAHLGFQPSLFRSTAFVISGGFTALAGALTVYHTRVVDFGLTNVHVSTQLIIMTVLGGLGYSVYGALSGAIGYVLLEDLFIGRTSQWPLLIAAAYVIIVRARIGGIAPALTRRGHSVWNLVRRRVSTNSPENEKDSTPTERTIP